MTPTTLAANAAQQGVTDLIARLMDAMPATQDWRSTELCGLLEEAAAALTTLSEQVAELTQERDELRREGKPADRALVDKYRNTKTGIFKFPDDVAAIIRALDAAEAKLARLEGERNMAVSALEFEAKRSRRHLAASTLAILAALTEGTPDE